MPDKDELLARKNTLQAMHAQHLANANACAGAMQECDYWLGVLQLAEASAAAEDAKDTEQSESLQ